MSTFEERKNGQRPAAKGMGASLGVWGLMLFSFACATTPPPPPPPPAPPPVAAAPKPRALTAEERFAKGLEALKARDYEKAAENFSYAVSKNDTMWAAHFNLALAREGLADVAGAEASYQKVLALKPDHKGALLNLGRLYRLKEEYGKAIKLYKDALKDNPYDVQLLNNLVVCLRLEKKYKEAEETVRRLLARAPRNADAYKNLSLIYYDQGKLRLAEFINANARKMAEKDGQSDPGVYNNMGMIHQKRGELLQALAMFKRAVELDPNFIPALKNVGAVAIRYRDYKLAESTFAKVVELTPSDYAMHLAYAWALEGNKKGKEALAEYEKVLAIRPDQPDAVYGVASVQFKLLKEPEKALEGFKRYVGFAGIPAAMKAEAEKSITTIENRLKAKRDQAARMAAAEEEEKERKRKEAAAAAAAAEAQGKGIIENLPDAPAEGETTAGPEGAPTPAADGAPATAAPGAGEGSGVGGLPPAAVPAVPASDPAAGAAAATGAPGTRVPAAGPVGAGSAADAGAGGAVPPTDAASDASAPKASAP